MHACARDYVHLRPLTGVSWPESLTSSPTNGHHDLSPGGVGQQLLQPLLLVHEEAVHLQLGEVSSTPCIRRRGENKIIAVDHLVVFVDDELIAASLLVVPDPDLVQGSRKAGSPAQPKC